MLQNIRQLAGEPPELTGNAAADTAALNRWHRKLMAGLEHLFWQIENEMDAITGDRAAMAERKMQAAKKRLERGIQNG
jgi:hypothetical protein